MGYDLDTAGLDRLTDYFENRIGRHLRDHRKRASFAMYAFGLMGDGERKSAEPIAARACGDPCRARAVHEKLLHFVGRSRWDDRLVRREAAMYALGAMQANGAGSVSWIVDDTGFLKQGTHSVGVQRQYTGSAGKIANCQLGVSLVAATPTDHLPIDFELYLPESWTADAARRREARIPDAIVFKTKIELAIDMMRRAHADEIPGDMVLADSFYGRSSDFRNAAIELGKDYAVAVDADTRVELLDDAREGPMAARDVATDRRQYRRVTWREGTRDTMVSRFCFRRVRLGASDMKRDVLLVIEWPEHEEAPTKFVITTLRRDLAKTHVIRLLKERWRTERAYEDLKGELGLDHFEGRSFPGWHHHISVALCCYAFMVAERVRRFPPSSRRPSRRGAESVAA